ncbi:uncharacterized protein LOC131842761 [Achroia grisella]|uniref:uncharacterized protein LOC131842761 n=1 Tax=Achroia grisella TaxID=688607 RepID=UPI0027D2056E|nr:uncharacterized protein LOC131842761 [Achroia grisella]
MFKIMRYIIIVPFLILFSCVSCKNNVKSLTESMGQEVIEINAPVKDLPDVEEEPSAEVDDDEKTTVTTQATTKKNIIKTTTALETRRKSKDIDIIDGLKPEDEEARIEKELAEIYKDNSDYKDSSESNKEITTLSKDLTSSALRLRPKNNFKFQPDVNDKAAVEKFRTSIDEISCGKVNKLTATPSPNSGNPQETSLTTAIAVLGIANLICF